MTGLGITSPSTPAAVGPGSAPGHHTRAERGPAWALNYLHLFRGIVVTLALVGAGVAWAWELPWLAAAGLAIAAGEWLESSYYIGVLRWGQQRGALGVTEPGAG